MFRPKYKTDRRHWHAYDGAHRGLSKIYYIHAGLQTLYVYDSIWTVRVHIAQAQSKAILRDTLMIYA